MQPTVSRDYCFKTFELFHKNFQFSEKFSSWELAYSERFGLCTSTYRVLLDQILSGSLVDEVTASWVRFRFFHGLFDSVSSFFVIGTVIVPLFHALDPEVRGVPFRLSLCSQSEWPVHSPHYGSHKTLSFAKVHEIDLSRHDVLCREKLDGLPFFKVRSGPLTYLSSGTIAFEVPADFPVEMAEWTSSGFHVLKPYGLFPLVYGGLSFSPHNWQPLDSSIVEGSSEGIFLLVDGLEYRVKKSPTMEINAETDMHTGENHIGVWEVALCIEGLRYIRPRPGKPTLSFERVVQTLRASVSCDDLEFPVRVPVQVTSVNTGPFVASSGIGDRSIWFDCGWRINADGVITSALREVVPDPIDLIEKTTDVFHHVVGARVISAPVQMKTSKNWVSGAKVVLFDTHGFCYAYKEPGKKLDLVGGKIERGENSYDCICRESKEEIDFALYDSKFFYH